MSEALAEATLKTNKDNRIPRIAFIGKKVR
jgi:hypothetical protein